MADTIPPKFSIASIPRYLQKQSATYFKSFKKSKSNNKNKIVPLDQNIVKEGPNQEATGSQLESKVQKEEGTSKQQHQSSNPKSKPRSQYNSQNANKWRSVSSDQNLTHSIQNSGTFLKLQKQFE